MVCKRNVLTFGGGFEQRKTSPSVRSIFRRFRHRRSGVVPTVPDLEAFFAIILVNGGNHAAAVRKEPRQPVSAARNPFCAIRTIKMPCLVDLPAYYINAAF